MTYFGLKVPPIWVRWGLSISYMGTWTLWVYHDSTQKMQWGSPSIANSITKDPVPTNSELPQTAGGSSESATMELGLNKHTNYLVSEPDL